MRILHVSQAWQGGGSALYASALAEAQQALGHDVARFGPEDVRGGGIGFRESWEGSAAQRAFSARLAGVDVVHVHHLAGLSLELPRLAREAGARVVTTLHDYWLACARGQLVDGSGERCPGPEPARCARCLAPHLWAPLPGRVARQLPARTAALEARQAAWRRVQRDTQLFLAPTRYVATRLGVDATVLPLPLLRPLLPAPPPKPGPLSFLYLGALLPTKGLDVLLDAYARLPAGAAELEIVGAEVPYDGTRAWVTRWLQRLSATPGARWSGALHGADVERALHAADVLVLPSVWEEVAGLVASEAAAVGVRVLASDIGGIAEAAPEATTVQPGSVEAWHAAMAAEVRRGKGRVAPASRPSLLRHAERCLELYPS